jgi:tetratricopeptide (TPR) repeat protein
VRFGGLVLVAALLGATPAHGHGTFHQQIAAADLRVAREPGRPAPLLARAELYRQHGDFEAALADLGEAARLAPADDTVDLLRGRTLVDAHRPQMAKTLLDRYVARHPDDAVGLLERARCHEAMVALQAAADDYERALPLLRQPSPDDYLRRMRAERAAGRDEAALGGLDEGIARLGPIASLELPAIELELAARRWDQALDRLDKVAALAPRKETFLARRGEILLQAGRAPDARRAFRAALDAIAALPPHLRATAAIAELEAKLRQQLRGGARGGATPGGAGSSRGRGR